MKKTSRLKILLLGSCFALSSCGEKRKIKKPSFERSTGIVGEYEKSLNAGSGGTGSVFDLSDLSLNEIQLLSLPELEELHGELKQRDENEKQQMKDLSSINKNLCMKLQEVRTQCSAIVRLVHDASIKLLACEGNRREAGAASTQIKVRIAGGGEYQLIANNAIQSVGKITAGENEVKFEGPEGEPNRIIDINEWRLRRLDGNIPEPNQLNFSFRVNEQEIFTSAHLKRPSSGAQDYLVLNNIRIREMLDKPECKVDQNEIVEIKRSAINESE